MSDEHYGFETADCPECNTTHQTCPECGSNHVSVDAMDPEDMGETPAPNFRRFALRGEARESLLPFELVCWGCGWDEKRYLKLTVDP